MSGPMLEQVIRLHSLQSLLIGAEMRDPEAHDPGLHLKLNAVQRSDV